MRWITECEVPVPGIPGTGNFHFFWWYRNRYRKNLVPEKSLGTGIGKIEYRKKVSEPVSRKFGTEKSTGIGIENIWFRIKVSVSVSFNILGTVTHCSQVQFPWGRLPGNGHVFPEKLFSAHSCEEVTIPVR